MTALLIIGGGRMGEALVGGLLDAGRAPDELAILEIDATRRAALAERHRGVGVVGELVEADGVLLAVKPHQIEQVCSTLADAPPRRVLSVAAGVTLDRLEAALPGGVAVVRAMPNTPSLVGAGVAAIAAGEETSEEDLAWAESILSAVGAVVRVPEPQLDAVTGLSGSGPAYLFLVAEAMVEGAVLSGLPRDVAETLAAATIAGAGKLLVESDESASDLRAAVTSPGGTTAVGLRALERAGVRAAVIDAVVGSAERSRQLAER